MLHESFDGAGFTDDSGHLRERKVPHGEIVVPEKIWLSGDGNLCWQFDFSNPGVRKPSAGMLHKFSSLWNSTDSAIVKYAKHWGPLRYSEAGDLIETKSAIESLAYWRFLSRRAFSVLAVAAELKDNRAGPEAYRRDFSTPHEYISFEAVHPAPDFFGFPNWARRELPPDDADVAVEGHWGKKLDLDGQRGVIAGELTYWLARFSPQLSMSWSRRAGWHLETRYHGRALPALALQLALTASGGDLYTCTACKKPYIRSGKRRPNAGQGNYCNNCGTGEALRRADERRRQKKADARRLFGGGFLPKEIAKELMTNVTTVQAWLKPRSKNR